MMRSTPDGVVRIGRRGLLVGAVGAGLAACGADDGVDGPRGDRVADGSFSSEAMAGAEVGWSVEWPPGRTRGDRVPVVLALHGRGGDHRTAFSKLGLGQIRDRLGLPVAIASVDGGDHTYYHRRADGTDAAAMIGRELLPVLAGEGLRI